MLRALLSLALVASVAVAQPPAEVVVAPPAEEAVEVVRQPVQPPRRLTLGGDIGPVFGGWGMWRAGTLQPTEPFAVRSHLFPIPVADYAHDVKYNLSIAARVIAGYTFENLPLSVSGSWETYHRHAETLLLGFDPYTAGLLGGLNTYNSRIRQPQGSWAPEADDVLGPWVDSDDEVGDHRQFPRLQLRRVPSEGHRLRSRVSVNIADFTLAYKLWSPREASGVEYRLLAGGRYGGFFTDDRAAGHGYEQSASNWFGGFGPHGGVRIDYRFNKRDDTDPAEFRLWGDVRGGALYGEVVQRFREADRVLAPDSPFRELVVRADRTVPFLATELGFGLFGARGGWLSVGVRYGHYWGIGDVGASRLSFAAVSGFFSLGFGF